MIKASFLLADNMPVNMAESKSEPISATSGGIQVYHLVLTALLSFALGGAVCVGVFLYCQRWQHAREEEQEKYATLTKHQVGLGTQGRSQQ